MLVKNKPPKLALGEAANFILYILLAVSAVLDKLDAGS